MSTTTKQWNIGTTEARGWTGSRLARNQRPPYEPCATLQEALDATREYSRERGIKCAWLREWGDKASDLGPVIATFVKGRQV